MFFAPRSGRIYQFQFPTPFPRRSSLSSRIWIRERLRPEDHNPSFNHGGIAPKRLRLERRRRGMFGVNGSRFRSHVIDSVARVAFKRSSNFVEALPSSVRKRKTSPCCGVQHRFHSWRVSRFVVFSLPDITQLPAPRASFGVCLDLPVRSPTSHFLPIDPVEIASMVSAWNCCAQN